jgi:hypothetical protein
VRGLVRVPEGRGEGVVAHGSAFGDEVIEDGGGFVRAVLAEREVGTDRGQVLDQM